MSKNNRRQQKPKPKNMGNEAYMRGMQELRRSSAAGAHKPKNAYVRKPKYGNRWDA